MEQSPEQVLWQCLHHDCQEPSADLGPLKKRFNQLGAPLPLMTSTTTLMRVCNTFTAPNNNAAKQQITSRHVLVSNL
jgi:hypothetical protein